jgi:hypothetical protein
LEGVLAKLSRYDEGTLFSSFLSFTVSKELVSFLVIVLVLVLVLLAGRVMWYHFVLGEYGHVC